MGFKTNLTIKIAQLLLLLQFELSSFSKSKLFGNDEEKQIFLERIGIKAETV